MASSCASSFATPCSATASSLPRPSGCGSCAPSTAGSASSPAASAGEPWTRRPPAGLASAGWHRRIRLGSDPRRIVGRTLPLLIDQRPRWRRDRAIEQRVGGGAHPLVEPPAHLLEHRRRRRLGVKAFGLVGVEAQVVELLSGHAAFPPALL